MRPSKDSSHDHYSRATVAGAEASPLSRGLVVALIGPDGVGKSSQTARLTSIIQRNRRCTAIYLGSGEGGWRFRRIAKSYFRKWRGRGRPGNSRTHAPSAGKEFGTNHSFFTGLSGLLAAIERYWSLRRAMRLASLGSIVICDRWPQNLKPGFFDGPLRLHPDASRIVRQLSRLERSFYRRMAAYRPDLSIHLVCDYETSNARKPGDRTPVDFDRRIALMDEMRSLDAGFKIVDARKGFDEVTHDLCDCIWLALAQRSDLGIESDPGHSTDP